MYLVVVLDEWRRAMSDVGEAGLGLGVAELGTSSKSRRRET